MTKKSIFCICVLFCLSGQVLHAAYVLWKESVQGDLSNDYLTPETLTLQEGDNLLTAAFNDVDLDLFTITVPSGMVMDGLWVNVYSHRTVDNVSFMGMQAGNTLHEPPSNLFSGEIGYTLFGAWALDGTNLLPIITNYPFLPDPLPAGNYAFWLNETTARTATTTLLFHATAIPELSTTPIAMLGASLCVLIRKRT